MTAPAITPAPTAIDTTYWYDGRLLGEHEIVIHPFAHALHYGSGVFEGIRSYDTPNGPAVFRLREHLTRLLASAAVYGLTLPHSIEDLIAATVATVAASGHAETYIRPLAFFGEGPWALSPLFQHNVSHTMIGVRAFTGSVAPGGSEGCRCTISPVQKTPSRSLPSTVKANGHYTNSILALHEAMGRGFDEALLLNEHGNVAEGTGENVFLVKDGTLWTNSPDEDVLDGITRRSVLELAADLGIPAKIAPITLDALLAADELFLTGTAAELVAVAAVDAHVYRPQRPVTQRLIEAYRAATHGIDPRHPAWVTYVRP